MSIDRSQVHELAEKILVESIRYPTVLGEAYEDIVNYYAGILREYGIHVTIHRVPDEYVREKLPKEMNPDKPRYILLARLGSSRKVLQFNGHYDVVFPGEGWSVTEPFKPVKRSGRIYGRGATDMKGGIAAFLAAMIYYALIDRDPGISIEAAIVPDEEIGGVTGTGYLVDVLGSRPNWVVIAEPSGIDNIWYGHKGTVWGIIRVYGRQAHGSTPWLGDNAFEKMVCIARYFIDNYLPRLRSKKSKYIYDLEGGEYPTATLGGKLIAPGSINIVPGVSGFSIDRRLIVEENTGEVIGEIKGVLEEAIRVCGNVRAELEVVEKMEPAYTNPNTEFINILAESIRKNIGVEPRRTICVGGLDLRYYAYRGIEVVAYGPGTPEMAHKVDEYIVVEDLYKAVDIYIDLISMLGEKLGD
jgi:succinyl-diaminopimelate desuccinylase